MRALATGVFIGMVAMGCGAGDDLGLEGGDGKEDSAVASAADRGEIVVGTSRRARFTEPGQTHSFHLSLAAGAAIRLDAVPSQANADSLKTTLALYGPRSAEGNLPRRPLANSADGTFPINMTMAAAGDYVIVVGTARKTMVGTYDLYAACENHACHPNPVTLRSKTPSAALKAVEAKLECERVSWCGGEVSAFTHEDAADTAAVMEAVIGKLPNQDAEWSTLEMIGDLETIGVEEKITLDGLVEAARDFADAREVEAFHVDGTVQIPVGDYGTDGWDEHLFVLHFPETGTVVSVHVRM